jgi:hypothetical protein
MNNANGKLENYIRNQNVPHFIAFDMLANAKSGLDDNKEDEEDALLLADEGLG